MLYIYVCIYSCVIHYCCTWTQQRYTCPDLYRFVFKRTMDTYTISNLLVNENIQFSFMILL